MQLSLDFEIDEDHLNLLFATQALLQRPDLVRLALSLLDISSEGSAQHNAHLGVSLRRLLHCQSIAFSVPRVAKLPGPSTSRTIGCYRGDRSERG